MQLLQKVNETEQKRKRSWKIQKIIGKRYLNGGIYYFMKWKDQSIFESDCIAQHGLWRLYSQQLKELTAKISVFFFLILIIKVLRILLISKKLPFQMTQGSKFLIINRQEKNQKRKTQGKENKERIIKSKVRVYSAIKFINHFRMYTQSQERFFRPIQTLDLKNQQYGVKTQENEHECTNDFLQSNFSFSETYLPQKNEMNTKFTKSNKDFHQKFSESDEEQIKSFKSEINEIISQKKTLLKNRNIKQDQKNETIQNESSNKIQKQKQPKLEPSEPHQLLKSSNLFTNKNNCLEFQQQLVPNEQIIDKSTFQHSAAPKLVKFQFDGSLSKSFFVDDCQISKSCQLSISQSNINNLRHFQSKILVQNFLTSGEINQQSSLQSIKLKLQMSNKFKFIKILKGDKMMNSLTHRSFLFKNKRQIRVEITYKKKFVKSQLKKILTLLIKRKNNKFRKKLNKKQNIISIKLFAQDILSLQNAEKNKIFMKLFSKRYFHNSHHLRNLIKHINLIKSKKLRNSQRKKIS